MRHRSLLIASDDPGTVTLGCDLLPDAAPFESPILGPRLYAEQAIGHTVAMIEEGRFFATKL